MNLEPLLAAPTAVWIHLMTIVPAFAALQMDMRFENLDRVTEYPDGC